MRGVGGGIRGRRCEQESGEGDSDGERGERDTKSETAEAAGAVKSLERGVLKNPVP